MKKSLRLTSLTILFLSALLFSFQTAAALTCEPGFRKIRNPNNPASCGLITLTQCDQAVKNEQLKWDSNGDGKIGLEDIIRMLQIIAGLRP